jgi:hypothetical protein
MMPLSPAASPFVVAESAGGGSGGGGSVSPTDSDADAPDARREVDGAVGASEPHAARTRSSAAEMVNRRMSCLRERSVKWMKEPFKMHNPHVHLQHIGCTK